jgi:hypothetical protein
LHSLWVSRAYVVFQFHNAWFMMLFLAQTYQTHTAILLNYSAQLDATHVLRQHSSAA